MMLPRAPIRLKEGLICAICLVLVIAGASSRGKDPDPESIAMTITNAWGNVFVGGPFTCTVTIKNTTGRDMFCDFSEAAQPIVKAEPKDAGFKRKAFGEEADERRQIVRFPAGMTLTREACLSTLLRADALGKHDIEVTAAVTAWEIDENGKMIGSSSRMISLKKILSYTVVPATAADWTKLLDRLTASSDGNVAARNCAIECVLSTDNKAVLPYLEKLLTSAYGRTAVEKIGRFSPENSRTVMEKALESSNSATVEAALKWFMRTDAKIPSETLTQLSAHQSAIVRYSVVEYIAHLKSWNSAAQSAIQRLQKDSVPNVAELAGKTASEPRTLRE